MRTPLIITLVVVALATAVFMTFRGNQRKAHEISVSKNLDAGHTKTTSVLTITLGANSSLQADGHPTDLLALEKLLKERSSDPAIEVILKSDPGSTFNDFRRVLDLAQQAGIKRVITSASALPRQKTPDHSP